MNPASDLMQIPAIRALDDPRERGIVFEQVVREIVPWSFRPPVAVLARGEQIDAAFEWNGTHFLVEAKARQGVIQRGSHDWEDFELKVRKRHGQCIGLFCSLFDVAEGVIDAADAMNSSGCSTIVLAGGFWDDLATAGLSMEEVLRYMVAHARIKQRAQPPPLKRMQAETYDGSALSNDIGRTCRGTSSLFLRRHRLARHADLYVRRTIDSAIETFSKALKPSALSKPPRESRHNDLSFTIFRQMPAQVAVVRDSSGAGKTTAAVEIASEREKFFGLGRAALEPDIDDLPGRLEALGSDHGLSKLRLLDRPLVAVVDSLDEAGHVPSKSVEVNSLLRSLDELNDEAHRAGLLGFPVGVVFTVREDYWERWAACFEGRNVVTLRHRFSRFTERELPEALARYSATYAYELPDPIPARAREVLEVPFNLHVYSEANEYGGRVDLEEVLSSNVLSLYFQRKREDVLKRFIPGLTTDGFIRVAAAVAMHVAVSKTNEVDWGTLAEIAHSEVPALAPVADQVVSALVSEQILVIADDDLRTLCFRHSRVIEYLVAYHIARELRPDNAEELLEQRTSQVFAAPAVSMFRVHELIRYICSHQFVDKRAAVDAFYARSSAYMMRSFSRLRAQAGHGQEATHDEIAHVLRASSTDDPMLAWEAFFVVAAKPNGQSKDIVLEAFERAWRANEGVRDRWKLLSRVDQLDLTLHEQVLRSALTSTEPREWETFLGAILQQRAGRVLREVLHETPALEPRWPQDPQWAQARYLLETALGDHEYVLGDIA